MARKLSERSLDVSVSDAAEFVKDFDVSQSSTKGERAAVMGMHRG